MGIQGLLPLLKSIHKPTHLRNFAGQTLGVDAYGWLHRGTVACAIELAEGKPTRKHIDFVLHRVRMLIHFGVKPYLVFDGDYLPSKSHTEKDRAARRKESKRLGLEMLRMGRPSQAQLELQKAVDVTPAMAREIIEELKKLGVTYVVAPYEADSQLAYLEKQGQINGVISEDSDLLVFGVKCLLTKLDQYGECIMVNRADFTSVRDVSLVGWTDKEFRMMTMLSGCDYLAGIDKMGLKTAYRLVRKHKSVERIVRTVQFDGKMRVPKDYLEQFYRAERTFLHQWVFCPEANCLVNLNPLPTGLTAESMPYIGSYVESDVAAGVACGDLDPNTKKPIVLPNTFNRLWQPPPRRTVSAPLEKHAGRPIDEFFKARRVPLAELDPNSLSLTPSQLRLLDQQGPTSWSTTPVTGAQSASRVPAPRFFGGLRTANVQPPSSAPQISRRTVTDPFPTHRASPKRQRLCSDSGITAAMKGGQGVESATSKFFAKAAAQPSPSVRRKSRRVTEEFDLWSDDSVAEALAAVTQDPELIEKTNVKNDADSSEKTAVPALSSPRKRKKLQVFADGNDATTSQSTVDTSETSTQSQASFSTTATSVSSSTQEHSVFSKGVRLDFEAMRYGGTLIGKKTLSRTASAPLFSRTPVKQSSTLLLSPKVEQSPADIDDSGIVLESPPGLPAVEFRSDEAEADSAVINVDKWRDVEKEPALFGHALSELPVKGSEDLLVPESPSEASDEGKKPALNLSRFAFAG
ncbi:unnamed protein product [Cercospora beticola]|nr:unnamed protein product [Cercospora beticola]